MPLLKRANEQTQTEWRPLDEGMYRFRVGKPELKYSDRYNNYQVRFGLRLTNDEQKRLLEEHEDDIKVHGGQQSYQTWYTVGLSLGYVDRTGQFKSTKLVDMLAACMGQGNTKKFRDWIAGGGGPPRPDDLNDDKAEIAAIEEWLGWWEDLEVIGTITQREGENGTVYANFAGPLAVGSIPGQKDPEYEAHGRGKLRAMVTASGPTREAHAHANGHRASDPPPPEVYRQDGTKVEGDGSAELPWG